MALCACFQCLQPHMTATTLRPFKRMALAMLVMTGARHDAGFSRSAGRGAVIGLCNAFSLRASRGPRSGGSAFNHHMDPLRTSTSWWAMKSW